MGKDIGLQFLHDTFVAFVAAGTLWMTKAAIWAGKKQSN